MPMKTSSYYPYGGLMGRGSMGVQPYKYGGKELDRENGLDLYDSHARMYDPIIGRTTTIDPSRRKIHPPLTLPGAPQTRSNTLIKMEWNCTFRGQILKMQFLN